MRRLPALVAAVSAATALVPAASAAAAWTAPATMSTPHTFVTGLTAATTGTGAVVAGWGYQDGVRARATTGARGATLQPGAAAFGPERALPAAGLIPYARRSVAALATSAATGGRTRLAVAFGSADGPSLRGARAVAVDDVAFVPRLAVGAQGSGLLAWIARASGNRRVVKVSLRAPGGRFGAPSVISGTGRANSITAAVGPQGQRVVAFERGGRLLARYRRAGRRWGPLEDLGPVAAGTDNELASLITSGGRAVVVDVHRQLTEGGSDFPLFVDAWVRPVGAPRFRSVQRLEQAAGVQAGAPALVPGDARGAILAWVGGDPGAATAAAGPATRVRVSVMGGDGRFGAPQPLSPAGQAVTGVAAAGDGAHTIVTWIRIVPPSDVDGQVLAAARPAFGAFGPVEEVSPSERASAAVPAFTGGPSGRAVVVWASRPGGEGPGVPLAQIQTFVRVAQRLP
jgi:hypothetical protein